MQVPELHHLLMVPFWHQQKTEILHKDDPKLWCSLSTNDWSGYTSNAMWSLHTDIWICICMREYCHSQRLFLHTLSFFFTEPTIASIMLPSYVNLDSMLVLQNLRSDMGVTCRANSVLFILKTYKSGIAF